jgi:hypothetical protein
MNVFFHLPVRHSYEGDPFRFNDSLPLLVIFLLFFMNSAIKLYSKA